MKPEFAKNYEKYYPVKTLTALGYSRHVCRHCGRGFWSQTDRDFCDEAEGTVETICRYHAGGGTTSLYFAAMDRRVKLAIIGGSFCTFRDSKFAIFHCICGCVPGIMQWCEMNDVAALIAPRPLLIISGYADPIVPFNATRKAYGRLAKAYRLLGVRKNLESDFFDGGHRWSNRKTLTFLRKHFGA